MKNFNEIFRNDVTYDNIKTQGPIVSLKNTFFEKPQGSGQIDLIPIIFSKWLCFKSFQDCAIDTMKRSWVIDRKRFAISLSITTESIGIL